MQNGSEPKALKNPSYWPVLFCFKFEGEGLPVSLPALPKNKYFRWRRLLGVQIGRWFFGAIEGGPGSPWKTSSDVNLEAPHADN